MTKIGRDVHLFPFRLGRVREPWTFQLSLLFQIARNNFVAIRNGSFVFKNILVFYSILFLLLILGAVLFSNERERGGVDVGGG